MAAVNPGALPEVATGVAGVQDKGRQVVALALAGAPIEGPDTRWLDMCAGPGGKAAVLAARVAERGGSLTAVELHEHRAQLVRQSLRPIRGRHEVIVADAVRDDIGSGYDRVLLDAPCTGLGALRRRPESRWRRGPRTSPSSSCCSAPCCAGRSRSCARAAWCSTWTCSPAPGGDPTPSWPRWAAFGGPGGPPGAAERRRMGRPALPDSCFAGPHLRLWPLEHDTDGMFAALIRRA